MGWLRKRLGLIAGLTVGGVVVWLITASLNVAEFVSPGSVFGRKVSSVDFLRAMRASSHLSILRYGRDITPEELEEAAWERLILALETKRSGIRISDKEVIDYLREQPFFQRDGRFDRQGYERLVRYALKTDPRTFEEETRQELAIQKLIEKAIGNPTATDEELKAAFRTREEAIRVSTLALPHREAAQEVTDAARQNPAFLAQAAQKWGLKLQTTDFFQRSSSLSDLDTVGFTFDSAFDLQPGEVTGPFPVQEEWLVVKLEAKRPPEEKRFDLLKESLEKEVVARKRAMAGFAWYQELLKKADLKRK